MSSRKRNRTKFRTRPLQQKKIDYGTLETRHLLATFLVTNLNDAGNGSLREAIIDSNDADGADAIDFSVTGTIRLSSQLPIIEDELVVNGPGNQLTIDAQRSFRHFEIDDGESGEIDVTLSGLRLINGSSDSDGGSIVNFENLSITNSTISNNTANDDGGAIFNRGFLTITNSSVSSNTAAGNGGGINSAYQLQIVDSSIGSNTANGNDGGGAIYNRGEADITNTSFVGNMATGSFGGLGGGILNDSFNGRLTIRDSAFDGNTAIRGGGIYNGGNVLTLMNTILSSNVANDNGGAIYNGYGTDASIINSSLTGNRTFENGGGVANEGDLNLINSTLSGNIANRAGGGVYANSGNGMVSVVNTAIFRNSADFGGGIYNEGSTVDVVGSTLNQNISSAFGVTGSILNDDGGTLSITNSTLSGENSNNNNAEEGIYNRDGTVNVNNSIVTGDTAGTLNGSFNIFASQLPVNILWHQQLVAN